MIWLTHLLHRQRISQVDRGAKFLSKKGVYL